MLWRAIRAAMIDTQQLQRFVAPVYVAVGTRSHPGFRATAEELVSVFSRASLDVYDDADHFEIHTKYVARLATALHTLWARETVSQSNKMNT